MPIAPRDSKTARTGYDMRLQYAFLKAHPEYLYRKGIDLSETIKEKIFDDFHNILKQDTSLLSIEGKRRGRTHIETPIGINNNRNKERKTLLYHAIEKNDNEMIDILLNHPSINVNKGNRFNTPLSVAIRQGNPEIVKKLLQHPSLNINTMTSYGRASEVGTGGGANTSILWSCANWGRPEIMKMLLERPELDVKNGCINGDSPLMEVVLRFLGCLDDDERIERDEHRKARNDDYDDDDTQEEFKMYNYFYDLYEVENPFTAYSFVEDGSSENQVIRTPEERRYLDCLDLLLQDPRETSQGLVKFYLELLWSAIQRSFLTKKQHKTCKYTWFRTRKTLLNRIEILLEVMKDVESRGWIEYKERSENEPPEWWGLPSKWGTEVASVCDNTHDNRDIVSYWWVFVLDIIKKDVLELIPDVNRGRIEGAQHYFSEAWVILTNLDTPLIEACHDGDMERIEELLTHPEIQVNKRNVETGNSALSVACMRGHLEVVKRLLKVPELDINNLNAKNKTPLSMACYAGHEEVVKLLLEDSRVKLHTWVQAVENAIETGKDDIMKLFIEKTKETSKIRDSRNRVYKKIIHAAVQKTCELGNMNLLDYLLENTKVSFERRGKHGRTPLMTAVLHEHENIVLLICAYCINRCKTGLWMYEEDENGHNVMIMSFMKLMNFDIFSIIWPFYKKDISREGLKCFLQEANSFEYERRERIRYNDTYSLPYHGYTQHVQGHVQPTRNKDRVDVTEEEFNKHKRNIFGLIREYWDILMLGEVCSFGRLPDGRKLPELPHDVYRYIGGYLKYDENYKTSLRKITEPDPDDELDLKEPNELFYHEIQEGQGYWIDATTSDLYLDTTDASIGIVGRAQGDLGHDYYQFHFTFFE
jgi:ankyrin repeat protein